MKDYRYALVLRSRGEPIPVDVLARLIAQGIDVSKFA